MTMLLMLTGMVRVEAQGTSYYEDPQYDLFQRELYKIKPSRMRAHTTVRHYKMDDLRAQFDPDSVLYAGVGRLMHTRIRTINNFFNDDLFAWRDTTRGIYVALNPLCDLEIGQDNTGSNKERTWTNSRGFYFNGNIGKKFWFYADFTENQAIYPEYYNNLLDSLGVVPGLSGFSHPYKDEKYDFNTADGYIGFAVTDWCDFLIGKTKTFVGDGYRSLLLGDGAGSVPTFRMNLTFLSVKYTFQLTQLRHAGNTVSNNGNKTKYSFTHFLDWNMGKRFTAGVFENVTMASWRKTGESRSLDLEYFNPFCIFRPGEFNAGSPDKMLVGVTGKFICTDWLTVYGQIMLNEFRIKEMLHQSRGYWSNKFGLQCGLRMTNLFRVDGLDFLFEYNKIRPYCYTQYDGMANYTHKKQSMGHPLGANLREGVAILSYHHGRIMARAQMNITKYGDDYPNDSTSYGHDPFKASGTHKGYGYRTLRGLETKLNYADISASFIVNPRSMLNVTMGWQGRRRRSDLTDETSSHLYVAARWSLKSHYYDY